MFITTKLTRYSRPGLTGRALAVLLMAGAAHPGFAADRADPLFESAEGAVAALYTAVKTDDQANLERLIGPLASSDEVARDKTDREQFVRKYTEMHRLVRQSDGTTVLYIGAENWPFPVPLRSKNGKWAFDVEAGTQEVFFRRIGENEIAAIQKCHDVGRGETIPAEGVQGYLLRALKTSNGTVSLVYPAEYGITAIMTFAVTPGGVIYEKDLGPDTVATVNAMTGFKRDRTWNVAGQ